MAVKIIEATGPEGAALRLTSAHKNGNRVGVDVYQSGNARGRADFYMDFDGPALRDALLEAFPLPEKKTGFSSIRPSVVPGQVYRDTGGTHRVILPNDKWHVV